MSLPAMPADQPDAQLRTTPAQRDNAVGLLREAASATVVVRHPNWWDRRALRRWQEQQ